MSRYYLFYESILKLAIVGKILYIIFALKSVKLKGLGLKKRKFLQEGRALLGYETFRGSILSEQEKLGKKGREKDQEILLRS